MKCVNSTYERYKEIIELHLVDWLPDVDHKSITLYEAMKYALTTGGKRLRPCLLLEAARVSGGSIDNALPYACAIEYIHTYSLIHDDLPCMDNDDFRRGKPTCHKQFDEAIATLAGDGLLTTAFEAMNKDMFLYFDNANELKKRVRASFELAKGAGCAGMLAGQTADIEMTGSTCTHAMLDYIHVNKTAALIIAAVRAGAQIGGADMETMERLTDFGESFGLAFQITDDLDDAETQDAIIEKCSFPAVYGLDESYKRRKELTDKARSAIEALGYDGELFPYFIDLLEQK